MSLRALKALTRQSQGEASCEEKPEGKEAFLTSGEDEGFYLFGRD